MRHFDEIWIPDTFEKTNSLSGDLSHKYLPKLNTRFIGILSQFAPKTALSFFRYDVAVILSGPEPHRSLLEKELITQLCGLPVNAIVVGGKLSQAQHDIMQNITYIPFANTEALQHIYNQSKYIICRSGYSSLMDLVTVGKTALIIPTPSQTEQEYLARYCSEKAWFLTMKQSDIHNLSMAYLKQLDEIAITDVKQFLHSGILF